MQADLRILADLAKRTEPLVKKDAKLQRLKDLLAGELKGRKTLVFTSYKDTSRYLERSLKDAAWLKAAVIPTSGVSTARTIPTSGWGSWPRSPPRP